MSNMRAAMLNRRIAKERKKKQEDERLKAEKQRRNVAAMNAGMAKAFRKKLKLTAEKMQVEVQQAESAIAREDKLRARLKHWERGVNEAREARGGEEGEIWNLEAQREAEKEEKARLIREAEEAKLQKERAIRSTIQELYKRILKIEVISNKIKESGVMAGSGAAPKGLP